MKFTILPLLMLAVFAFSIFITRRAKRNQAINHLEARSVYIFIGTLVIWGVIAIGLGLRDLHTSPWLLKHVPLLWQACVSVVILTAFQMASENFRSALSRIATNTPFQWMVFVQALRIGAIGSIIKVSTGVITSNYPWYWRRASWCRSSFSLIFFSHGAPINRVKAPAVQKS